LTPVEIEAIMTTPSDHRGLAEYLVSRLPEVVSESGEAESVAAPEPKD
jgi:hypothetical protein